ncbi:MAG: hypothetical protein QGH60_07265 [Phycisphaerae bacterium]|jgi:hypothetical protein|nr:hypothetical protein [Phycisphaerae bacterium]
MQNRRFILSLIVLAGLIGGLGMNAMADYGITSSRPLSDPLKAKIDQRLIGTWRTVIRGETYYFHIGAGNILGKLNWMELALVKPGKKKPAFYMRHFIGFPTIIGDKNYFNIGYTSKLIPQLRGSKPEELIASVDRYDIFQYKLDGDHLDILAPDQKFIRSSIKAGKIKGKDAKANDTAENLREFIKSVGKKMFPKKFRYTRVKDPESPSKKPAPTKKKPAKGPERAKTPRKTAAAKPAKPATPVKKPA